MAIFSLYLSIWSNTLIVWDIGYKIFFGIIAFLFPSFYLPSHLLHKWDLINFIKRQNNALNIYKSNKSPNTSPNTSSKNNSWFW